MIPRDIRFDDGRSGITINKYNEQFKIEKHLFTVRCDLLSQRYSSSRARLVRTRGGKGRGGGERRGGRPKERVKLLTSFLPSSSQLPLKFVQKRTARVLWRFCFVVFPVATNAKLAPSVPRWHGSAFIHVAVHPSPDTWSFSAKWCVIYLHREYAGQNRPRRTFAFTGVSLSRIKSGCRMFLVYIRQSPVMRYNGNGLVYKFIE